MWLIVQRCQTIITNNCYISDPFSVIRKVKLSVYKQENGLVQFPLDRSTPYDLIERIVQFKAVENNENVQL
jgi:hypothetical protein